MGRTLIASMEWGTLTIDSEEPGEWLRRSSMRGSVVYCDATVGSAAIESLVTGPEDYAFGRPGMLYGCSLRTAGKGRIQVFSGDAWASERLGSDALAERLRELTELCAEYGVPWRATAASSVSALLRGMGLLSEGATKPRFRTLARECLHVAPILHCVSDSPDAVYLDRSRAFLAALEAPMPRDGWHLARTATAASALRSPGQLVCATVDVEPSATIDDCPPLPIRDGECSIQPVGTFTGCWTSDVLRDAVEECGARILRVWCVARPGSYDAWLRPAFDRLCAMPKKLSKPMYSRIWGKFAGGANWTGTVEQRTDRDFPAGSLWWRCEPKPEWETRVSDALRPDLASFIVADNFRTMRKAIHGLRPGTLISAHIDSIFTEDPAALQLCKPDPKPGEWRLEGTGPVRAYNHGVYEFRGGMLGEKLAAMGWQADDRPTRETLAEFAAGGTGAIGGRSWNGDPRTQIGVDSSASFASDREYNFPGFRPWDPEYWTAGGYFRPEKIPSQVVQPLEESLEGVL